MCAAGAVVAEVGIPSGNSFDRMDIPLPVLQKSVPYCGAKKLCT